MAGYRFWLQSSLSVVMALVLGHAATAQTPWPFGGVDFVPAPIKPGLKTGVACKVYSLSELGDDPKLCKWIADTIPEMIQPASWKQGDAKIRVYAPSRILVVSNTPAVHAQVEEFLQNMKKMVAQSRPTPGLLPAQFAVPDSVRAAQGVQSGPGGYPVPITPQAPKHLFHFIIRYEGEGIVDSNVVKFAKALKEATENGSAKPEAQLVPPPPGDAALRTPPTYFPMAPQATGAGTTVPTQFPAKSNAPVMPPADPPPTPSSPTTPSSRSSDSRPVLQ